MVGLSGSLWEWLYWSNKPKKYDLEIYGGTTPVDSSQAFSEWAGLAELKRQEVSTLAWPLTTNIGLHTYSSQFKMQKRGSQVQFSTSCPIAWSSRCSNTLVITKQVKFEIDYKTSDGIPTQLPHVKTWQGERTWSETWANLKRKRYLIRLIQVPKFANWFEKQQEPQLYLRTSLSVAPQLPPVPFCTLAAAQLGLKPNKWFLGVLNHGLTLWPRFPRSSRPQQCAATALLSVQARATQSPVTLQQGGRRFL